MEPSAAVPVDPALQPLVSLLNPALMVWVPVIIMVTAALLKWTPLKRVRDFGFLVAIALGMGCVMLKGPRTWDGAVSGVVLGLVSAIAWKAGHETRKVLTGAAAALLLLVPAAGMVLLATGCGDPAFTRYAVADGARSMEQARVALAEAQADLEAAQAREADVQWQAYVGDQADTFAKALEEAPTPEALRQALKDLAVKFRTERLGTVERNRQRLAARFRRADEHLTYVAQIFARLDAQARREESVQAQLAQYRDLAEQIARQRFGLPSLTAPPETPAPTVAQPQGQDGAQAAGGEDQAK